MGHNEFISSSEAADTGRRPRLALELEETVLDLSFRFPTRGQDRIARELRESKTQISASGVRYVWQRHNLETLEKRVAWIESRLGRNDRTWSEEQLTARERVRSDRKARTVAVGLTGQNANEVPRSMHILAVAARLLRSRSYEAVSLRDIAVASHIPLGSIYYNFSTKEELFSAVYEEGIRRLQNSTQNAISTIGDPWQRLEAACAAHLDNLCGGDDFMAVSIPTRLPDLSIAARSHIHRLGEDYERIFRELIEALPLPSDISRSILRLQLLGALNWTSIWYKSDKLSPTKIAAQLVRSFRFGATPHT
jgi:AcrR family transcriptional regulator